MDIYVMLVYGIIFVLIGLYVVSLWYRSRKTEEELTKNR